MGLSPTHWGAPTSLETLAAWKAGVEFTNDMRRGEAT